MLYFSHLVSCFLRPWICQCFARKPTVVVYGIDLSRHHSVRRVPALGLKRVSAFVFLRRSTLDSNTRQLPSHCPLFDRSLPLLRSKCHRPTTRPALALDTASPRPLKTSRPQDSAADIIRMRRFEDPTTDVAHIARGQPTDGSYRRRAPYLLPSILALIFAERDLSLAGFASPLIHILSHAFIVEYLYLDHLLSI